MVAISGKVEPKVGLKPVNLPSASILSQSCLKRLFLRIQSEPVNAAITAIELVMLPLSGASRLCALIALGHGVAGLRWEGSQPTSSSFNTYHEMRSTPKPTVGISQVSLGGIELFRRQDSQSNVCGYINGQSGTLNSLKFSDSVDWNEIS
jgi:hypothetical protein